MAERKHAETVGQWAAQHPRTKAVFERFGIDYCCGGSTSLAVAAQECGHTLAEVTAALDAAVAGAPGGAAAAERDWSAASASDLAQHILDSHHAFLKRELPRLAALFRKVLGAHGARHGATLSALQEVFAALQAELEMHLLKEERILFPYILELDRHHREGGRAQESHCGTVRNPIRQMEHEHEAAGTALARLREISGGYALPADACVSYAALYEGLQALEADLHEHIHLENNILFPAAVRLETGNPA